MNAVSRRDFAAAGLSSLLPVDSSSDPTRPHLHEVVLPPMLADSRLVEPDRGTSQSLMREPTGTSRSVRSFVTPWDFGDITGEASNDTLLIEKAAQKALKEKKVLYFPAAQYAYSGTGLAAATMVCFGDSPELSIVRLGMQSYFFSEPATLPHFELEGIQTIGGLGILRSTYRGHNVAREKYFRKCKFKGYSRCAIETNTIDGPYWKINNCEFYGKRGGTSIGVALSGLCDEVDISGNDFADNHVAIKLGRGGINALIDSNSFLRFSEGTGRVDIWLVLSDTTHNFGDGLCIDRNKFGNENMNQFGGDFKILCAEEDMESGTSFGDRTYSLRKSQHRIGGFRVHGGSVANRSDRKGPNTPLVMTTTGAFYAVDITQPPVVSGTPPSALIAFLDRPSLVLDRRLFSAIRQPRITSASSLLSGSTCRQPVRMEVRDGRGLVLHADHQQSSGSVVRLTGASDPILNGTFKLRVVNDATYEVELPVATKATGAVESCWAEVRNLAGVGFGECRLLHTGEISIPAGTQMWAGPGGGALRSGQTSAERWGWRWPGRPVVIRSGALELTWGGPAAGVTAVLASGSSNITLEARDNPASAVPSQRALFVPAGSALGVTISNHNAEAVAITLVIEYEEVF